MSIDFGRAPRGDPRMPHVSEKYFGVLFCAGQAVQMLAWARGRVLGVTEVRPRKYDRDLLLAVCKENKQKRQRACGQMPTHRLRAPNVKRGLKHGWGPAWFEQFHYNSWTEKRMGPAY